MTTYKLVTIDQRFTAETIARTGSEQLLEKAMRSFVGLYNEDESWYIPLRANLGNKKKDTAIYKTPFPTSNPHFKNPGLDFEKAVYVPNHYVIEIQNTLPEEQSKLIFENQEDIRNRFENYVLSVESMEKGNSDYLFSTVPLFPEGIERIKQIQQVRESMKSFTLNGKKENTELTEENGNSKESSFEEYKYLTGRIVELERKEDYGEGHLEELTALRNRAESILTLEQKEHIIEFLKTLSNGEHIKIIPSDDGMTDDIYFGNTFIEKKVDLFEEKAFHTWSNFLISNFETTPYSINYIDLENAGYDPNIDINHYKNHKENIDNQEIYKEILAVDNKNGVALQYSIQKYQLPEYKIIDTTGRIIKDETTHMEIENSKNYFFNRKYFKPLDEYELDMINNKYEEYTFTTNEKEIDSFRTPLSENIKSKSAVFSNEQINTMTLQKLNNDIKNYLSSTEKDKSLLHEKDEKKHIEYMQKLFDSLENKPGFITQNKLDSYAAELGVMDLTTAIKNDNKKAIKEILAAGIKEYLQSDTYKNFLNFASSMHQYSQKNLRLILSQYPNASLIASHTDWKAKGRYINKGSKAIRVYAPIFGYKKDEEGNFIKDEKGRKIPTGEIVAWRLAPVFDVSQTNGKEIPKQLYELTENFKSPEAFTSIFNAVKKCTTATVSFGDMNLSPGARGYYIPATHEIVIKKGMSTYHTLKTEIHEVVHSVLHNKQNEFISAAQMEFEAESVAYIVCNHFGVDTSDYSFGYLSSWTEAGSKLEEFEQSLATICNTAKSLITQIEKEINQELNIKENKVQEKLNPYQEKIRKAQEQLKVQSENKTEQNNLVKK
jgi:pcfD